MAVTSVFAPGAGEKRGEPQPSLSLPAHKAWGGYVLAFCLFETAFYFAYRYGMAFSHATPSPFWFPDSVLLCALLLVPPRWWWLVLLAPLPIRLTVAVPPDTPFWFLLATFAIDSAKGVFAATTLRRFTRELGAARNIDVILATLPLNDRARGHLEDDRKRIYAKIIRKLDSRSFRLFIFDLFAWMQAGKWRSRKKASGPLMPFAIKRLNRLWQGIEQRSAHVGRNEDKLLK